MANNVSPSNPLGLEPSELAASNRAKAAAAAREAASPTAAGLQSLADKLRATISPVTDAEKAAAAAMKSTADVDAAKAAKADALKNAEETAKLIGGTVSANGTVIPPAPPVPVSTGVQSGLTDAEKALIASATAAANNAAAATAASAAQAAAAAAATKQNAIAFLTSTFNDLGLGADIASAVTNLVQQGYTADTIQMIAQDPKSKDPLAVAFKARFPANEARMNAGLPVLSPSEYLATERSYAQVLGSYGLNNNFATNKDIFTKLLTNDISPSELNTRANTAKQVIENTDPAVSQQLQNYYGLSQGDMIAHVLDPSIATPIIEQQIATSQIGAEAARAGANINQSYADQLRSIGITQSQANAGFQSIAQSQTGMQELATRYDAYGPAGQIGQQLQAATFGTTGAAAAQADLARLKQQEVSQFSGSSGAGKGSLMGTEAGLS
jgi:hypothetical protein